MVAFGLSRGCPDFRKARIDQTDASADRYRSALDDKVRRDSLVHTFVGYSRVWVEDALVGYACVLLSKSPKEISDWKDRISLLFTLEYIKLVL